MGLAAASEELLAGAGGRRQRWFVKLLGHPQTGEGWGCTGQAAIARGFSTIRISIRM